MGEVTAPEGLGFVHSLGFAQDVAGSQTAQVHAVCHRMGPAPITHPNFYVLLSPIG